MAKLIVIVGNSGVGKTTLTRALCEHGGYNPGLEQHLERPFQALFKNDPRTFALANQIDYLLLRAEQEQFLRSGDRPGVQDGGLDMDFYVFTRLFLQKGYLIEREFSLCERLLARVRSSLPPPEVVISMNAPLEIIAERFARRSRPLEITQREDLAAVQVLLDAWLADIDSLRLLRIDASDPDPGYRNVLPALLDDLVSRLAETP